ncbi:hypothetical protein [Deinococcus pimensis]|uniref:hypothetical protein n=1 Tax=Deinococcus pimensis TaxID=309888 RepID=UPI00047F7D63|nr:hypothetical protein [Deinococcus pimensis]
MPETVIASAVLYERGEVLFVGAPDTAHAQARRFPTAEARDESVRVAPLPPRKVLLGPQTVSVTVARALAGMLERATHDEVPGSVGGVQVDVPADGVVRLSWSSQVAHLDYEAAEALADALRRHADEADPDEERVA